MNKRQFFSSLALVALMGLTACGQDKPAFRGVDITGADYAQGWALRDQNGQERTLKDFAGKVVIVFFGYTQCPDVCPTSMQELAEVKRLLGKDGERLQGVFITVDPDRDTAELLKAYMANFDPGFVAMSAALPEIHLHPASITADRVINAQELTSTVIRGTTSDVSAGQTVFLTLTDSAQNSITVQTTTDAQGEWSYSGLDWGQLTDGPVQADLEVTNIYGATATSSHSFHLDRSAPAASLSVLDLNDSGANNTDRLTQDRSFTLLADNVERGASTVFEMSTDNGTSWVTTSAQQTNLTDGRYLFRASVTDAAGNTAISGIQTVVVDTQSPSLPQLLFIDLQDRGASNTEWISQDRSFTLAASNVETGASTVFEVSTDNGTSWVTTSAQQTDLTDGRYIFRAVVTDMAGNARVSGLQVIVVESATAPPEVKANALNLDALALFGKGSEQSQADFSPYGFDPRSLDRPDPMWTSFKGELPKPAPSLLRPDTQWLDRLSGHSTWDRAASTTNDWMNAGQDWQIQQPMSPGFSDDSSMTRADGFPVVVNALSLSRLAVLRGQPDQSVTAGQTSLIQIGPDAFAHVSAEAQVKLTLTLSHGQALPTWARFNGQTGQLLVTPPEGAPQQLVLRLTAQDQDGENVSTNFVLTVQNKDPAPTGRMSFSDKLRHANSVTRAAPVPLIGNILRHG